jgi:hypothetical protein
MVEITQELANTIDASVLLPRDATLVWRKSGRNSSSNVLPEGIAPSVYDIKVGDLPVASILVMLQRAVTHGYNNQAASSVKKDMEKEGNTTLFADALHAFRLDWKKRAMEGFKRARAAEPMPEYDPRTTMARVVAFEHLTEWARKRNMTDFPTRVTAASLKKTFAGPGGKDVTLDGLIVMMLDEATSPRAAAIWNEADRRLESAAEVDDDFFTASDDDADADDADESDDDDAEDEEEEAAPTPATRRGARASGK